MLIFKYMSKKVLNIFLSILFLLPFFTGTTGVSQPVNRPPAPASFQKPCDMDRFNP